MLPKVSVLITTHNSEKFINHTLQSVLWQTLSNIEILIVDNNSEDKTINIVKELTKNDKRFVLFASSENL